MNSLIEQIIKFCGVGVVMLIFSTTMFYLCFEVLDLPLYATYIGLYLIAIYISYVLNAKYTFQAERSKSDLVKYYIVYLLGMSFGLLILYFLSQSTSFSKFHMTLIQIVPRTIFTFILTKLIIYK
jgi:putative flippase GtrA